MTSAPNTEIEHKHRRSLLLLVALIAFICHGGDVVMLGGPSLPAFLARLLWGTGLAALAWVAGLLPPWRFGWIVGAAGLVSVAGWVSLTDITGGSSSPYFHWMSVLPLVVGALAPGSIGPVAVVGLATILANTVLLILEGATGQPFAMWISFSCTTSALAVSGSYTHRRIRSGERRAEEARMQALDELAESEQRRLHAEKLALLGKLSSGVAHEINNPLAFLRSSLAVLRERHGAEGGCAHVEPLREVLDECEVATERISEIIDSLRSFARVDGADVGPCELDDVIDEALLLASISLQRIRVVRAGTDALPAVLANRGQLVQVLVNLLVNAADAIGEANRSPGLVRIEGALRAGEVLVDVIDDGVGLSAVVQRHLFEPFFTTKPAGSGTGLGLALSREYLQRFQATLEAANEPQGGARFRVRLRSFGGLQHTD